MPPEKSSVSMHDAASNISSRQRWKFIAWAFLSSLLMLAGVLIMVTHQMHPVGWLKAIAGLSFLLGLVCGMTSMVILGRGRFPVENG